MLKILGQLVGDCEPPYDLDWLYVTRNEGVYVLEGCNNYFYITIPVDVRSDYRTLRYQKTGSHLRLIKDDYAIQGRFRKCLRPLQLTFSN